MGLFYVPVIPNIMGLFYVLSIMGLFYVKRPIVYYGSFLCTAPPTVHKKDP